MNATALAQHARDIWQAGVDAVRAERLMQSAVQRDGDRLVVCGVEFALSKIGRIAVVGCGKAGAGMAAAIEEILGPDLLAEKVNGWVNVPADCVRPLKKIHLHAARPAGVNEPTAEGVEGAERILAIVEDLRPDDICLVLISGGGSALLPAPVPDITLADKQAVTRLLMHGGATIQELNTVRKQLSQIKGGGLAWRCGAGRMIGLIISDVIGDPLDIIASGPTVADSSTPADALAVLERYAGDSATVPSSVWTYLRNGAESSFTPPPVATNVANYVIGNNRVAIDAAAKRAVELGYAVHDLGSDNAGEVNACGAELADLCRAIRDEHEPAAPPVCVLSGGEPVVHVAATDQPRKGGRNQQLVLAALDRLWDDGLADMAILSGGTDGEDGPTDAAGAWVDAAIRQSAVDQGLSPAPYLAINDSYTFFAACGGLIITGPTHTNVMDLRVAVIGESD